MTSPKKVKMGEEVEVMQVAKLSDKAIIPTKVRLLYQCIQIVLAQFILARGGTESLFLYFPG